MLKFSVEDKGAFGPRVTSVPGRVQALPKRSIWSLRIGKVTMKLTSDGK
ncbi:MAG: hypothetical protein ACE5FF_09540 [Saprospiraceae bacterium]